MELLNPLSVTRAKRLFLSLLPIKGSVKALADTNVTISGIPPPIDDITIADGDRVLLTDQTTGAENGIWIVRTGSWERPEDFPSGGEAAANLVFVQQGTTHADTGWLCENNTGADVIDANTLVWSAGFGGGSGGGPSGAAGGDLDGFYPNPDVIAVHTPGERLPIGTIVEGQFLRRNAGVIESASAGVWVEEEFIATQNQTTFTLLTAPLDIESFRLTINGVFYTEGVDFSLIGDTINWFGAFNLDAGDEVVAKYIDLIPLTGGSQNLGLPTDGTYLDGLLPFTPSTRVADAIDAINEVLLGTAPAPPGGLAGTDLNLTVTSYSAKLPFGLAAGWNPYTPGDTISGLVFSAGYSLTSADPATRFAAGLWGSPPSDSVTHVLNGSDGDSRPIADGVGSTGQVQITAVDNYNTLWRKVNARINHTGGEGQITHRLKSGADQTDETKLYYDDVNDSPTFAAAPTHVVSSEFLRYLSGIPYYREGTVFDVSYTANPGIFRKHYHATQVSSISIPGASVVTVNPPSVPSVNDSFSVVAQQVTLASGAVALTTAQITVTLRKANTSTQAGDPLARGVNIYASGNSSNTTENFVDEIRRLVPGTLTAWTPTDPLLEDDAQARNGSLVHGRDGDYPGHALGSEADYERIFGPGTQSGGTVRLGGVAASLVSQFNTGTLNIFLYLAGDNKWFDLGLDSPFLNGTGDGSSIANSIGGRFSAAGGDLVFTLAAPAAGGPYSTGGPNSGQYRLLVRFRGASGLAITSVEAL